MSENTSLNSADGVPPSIQRVLSKLEAEPLAVNRDELFFQAGFAAGSRKRTARFFWPSAAAALLLMCAGLVAALLSQGNRTASTAKQQAFALNLPDQQSAQEAPARTERTVVGELQSRLWQRLASTAPLPPGQLTAIGLTEMPARADRGGWAAGDDGHGGASREQEPARQPTTYLELRLLQEG